MEAEFSKLVDIDLLQQLMENLWRAAGLPVGILDPEGNLLVATGWQPICAEFHRRNQQSLDRCRERDAYIKKHLARMQGRDSVEPVEYLCPNGLIHAALPIVIDERHMATLFVGQFLYHSPDEETFRRQAFYFGFDEEAYIAALRGVPIFSREKAHSILAFYSSFVHLLGRLGNEKLRRLRAQKKLVRRKRRLRLQNREMRRISGMRSGCTASPESFIPHILETTARTLDVNRVGFWRFTGDGRSLVCRELFDDDPAGHCEEERLATDHFPDYFLSLSNSVNIAAADARADPRTRELTTAYLEPRGITSLLSVPLWLDRRRVGVLCCEHRGDAWRWSLDEQNFVASMADQVSQALESQERRAAEESLRQSEEKYRLLFSNDSDAILFFDAETLEIEEVNEAAAVLYGYSRKEFAALRITDISADPEKSRERIWRARQKVKVCFPESLHRRRDGSEFPVEVSHGNFTWNGRRMCVGVVRDISERQEMMRLKDEMLSAVSHEIRTPLTAILGFAEFLRANHDKGAPVADYLDIILREGERLRELTDNLLDLQRLRAGFGRKNFRFLEVPPLLASASQLFDEVSSRHRLVLCRPDGLPALWGDERQIYRALQNLLSNACKYSPEGSTIELGVRSEDDFMLFWVRDEGEGIPPEYQKQIFDRFFRIDYRKGSRVGGTGLGLALVKAIAEAHRGQVWVESEPGRGSTFLFSIPFGNPEA